MKVYTRIAQLVHAIQTQNPEWSAISSDKLDDLLYQYLPHGSGFDMGTKIDLDKSTAEKVYLVAPFHHMDQNGFYCGWSDHVIRITPSLRDGFDLKISNPDRAKSWDMEYFYETFQYALSQDAEGV
jgi:hypothetical protein